MGDGSLDCKDLIPLNVISLTHLVMISTPLINPLIRIHLFHVACQWRYGQEYENLVSLAVIIHIAKWILRHSGCICQLLRSFLAWVRWTLGHWHKIKFVKMKLSSVKMKPLGSGCLVSWLSLRYPSLLLGTHSFEHLGIFCIYRLCKLGATHSSALNLV